MTATVGTATPYTTQQQVLGAITNLESLRNQKKTAVVKLDKAKTAVASAQTSRKATDARIASLADLLSLVESAPVVPKPKAKLPVTPTPVKVL